MLKKENVATSFDNIRRSISGDKLHRRNPITVRQEIQSFDDVILETTLSDVQLNELPGLQNTEEWKRIATRSFQAPSPLSHEYDQTKVSTVELQNEQTQDVLESYRQTQDTENEGNKSTLGSALWRTPGRRILFMLSIIAIIVAIIVAVVVAVVLVRKPSQIITDYYSGYILVRARFDPLLLSSSSTLTLNYRREFCSLIGKALIDTKTKYAIFYSSCHIDNFRNGSIIGDFILGFTRYQNVTRLNAFLNRTLIHQQLFGGTVLSIVFNSTIIEDTNSSDYSADYDVTDLINTSISNQDILSSSNDKLSQNMVVISSNNQELEITEEEYLTSISTSATEQSKQLDKQQTRIERYLLQNKLVLPKQDYYTDQSLYNDKSSLSLTTVSYHWSLLDTLTEIHHSSVTKLYEQKFTDREPINIE
ncbi:unnamed protein product [Rotaria sp. Silwood2]|nr:unnamed protein product [Rotaria sp. Silwood2]